MNRNAAAVYLTFLRIYALIEAGKCEKISRNVYEKITFRNAVKFFDLNIALPD